LVRDLKDAARMVNYSYSAAVTSIAMQNKIPYIAAVESVRGYEAEWSNANNSKSSYLPFKAFDEDGQPIPPPRRQEPAVMPAAQVQMLQLSIEQMRAVSGQQNANFGIRSEAASGIGIQRLKQQGEVATFHFPDNLTRALKYEAKVLIDLIQKYYDTRRVVRILGLDNKTELATLDPGAKQAYAEQQIETQKDVAKIFNPTLGRYDVAIDTGPDYMTQRQEAFTSMTQLAGQDPTLMQKAGDIIVRAADFPMADQLADRLEKSIPPEMRDDKENAQIPAAAQAQIGQMTQQMQQMAQMLDAAQAHIAELESDQSSKQFEAQAKAQELELKSREIDIKERESEIKAMEAQAKLNQPPAGPSELDFAKAGAQAEVDRRKLELETYKAETERMRVEHDAAIADRSADLAEATALRAATPQEATEAATENSESQALVAVMAQVQSLQETIQTLSAPKRKVARFVKNPADGSWMAESVETIDDATVNIEQ
jgi:hypothetical protein